MIDLKILREDPERVRLSQKVRGESVEIVDQLLALDLSLIHISEPTRPY